MRFDDHDLHAPKCASAFAFFSTSQTTQFRPSQSHFKSNKSILVKLTRLTIETGLVTTVAALLELIIGIAFKTQLYHIAVYALPFLNVLTVSSLMPVQVLRDIETVGVHHFFAIMISAKGCTAMQTVC